MSRLSEQLVRLRSATAHGGDAYYDDSAKIGIAVILKCASKSLESGAREIGLVRRPLHPREGYRHVALIREPCERWASGVSTHLAARYQTRAIYARDAKAMLDDGAVVQELKRQPIRDVHTKPQTWYLGALCDDAILFPFDRIAAWYGWLHRNGVSLPRRWLHQAICYEPASVHRVVYLKAMKLVQHRADIREAVSRVFSADKSLYARAQEMAAEKAGSLP